MVADLHSAPIPRDRRCGRSQARLPGRSAMATHLHPPVPLAPYKAGRGCASMLPRGVGASPRTDAGIRLGRLDACCEVLACSTLCT